MKDQRSYWEKKILAWEQSAYANTAPSGQPMLERLATPWRKILKHRLTTAERLVADQVAGKVVADVGCGSGIFLRALLKYRPKYCIGIDIAQSAINAARQEAQRLGVDGQIKFVRADGRREFAALAQADLVTGIGLLDYFNAEETVALFKHLQQKQWLFSVLPPSWSPRAVLHRVYLKLAACPGSYRHSRATMGTMLHTAGVQQWRYADPAGFVTNIPHGVPPGEGDAGDGARVA